MRASSGHSTDTFLLAMLKDGRVGGAGNCYDNKHLTNSLLVINLANEVFGFNGWSSSIVSLTTDFVS